MAFEWGQYIPGNSVIHRLDPRVKLVGLFLYGLALLMAPTGESAFLIGVIAVPAVLASGLSPAFIWRQLKPLVVFLAFIFFLQLVTTPGTIEAYVGPVPVTREGFNLGLLALARVFFLVLVAILLTATTDPLALADGLERLLGPGQRLGLPTQELALMLTLALRFVPTLTEEAERVMRAQIARGASFRGLQVRNLLPLIIPLFVSAFRRAEGLAEAMEARAYQGGKGRTRMRELNFTATDFFFLLIACALATGTLFYRLNPGH